MQRICRCGSRRIMADIFDNVTSLAPFVLVPWGIFIICTFRGKQRFRNSFWLMVSLAMSLFFIAGLFGSHMATALIVEVILVGWTIILVPFLLMHNGAVMRKKEGGSLANQMSMIMGILILLGEAAFFWFTYKSIGENQVNFFDKICCLVGYSALYFCFVFLCFMFYVISIQLFSHTYKYDYIVIHGCGLIDGHEVSKLLSQRIDTAIKVYNKCISKGRSPIIIPSGGKGDDEELSEAEAMGRYLVEHGIPEEHIILEDRSPTTRANLVNSKAIIESRGGGRVAIVTSNYHVYRCLVLAQEVGLECTGIGSPVALYFWPSALIREFVAIFSQKKKLGWLIALWALMLTMFIGALW